MLVVVVMFVVWWCVVEMRDVGGACWCLLYGGA